MTADPVYVLALKADVDLAADLVESAHDFLGAGSLRSSVVVQQVGWIHRADWYLHDNDDHSRCGADAAGCTPVYAEVQQ